MTHLNLKYPWHRVQRGGSFFVPALDTAKVQLEGVQQARRQHITRATGTPCIYNGVLGVMFKRR
ncbi:hypothetical protein K0U83_18450 [bacterium]|nr:hypothetical protein [bacterium]